MDGKVEMLRKEVNRTRNCSEYDGKRRKWIEQKVNLIIINKEMILNRAKSDFEYNEQK